MNVEEFVVKFSVRLPEKFWNKIKVLDEISGLYCYTSPVEHEKFCGFFYVPMFENLVVSKDLEIFDLTRKKSLTWSIWTDNEGIRKGGYKIVSTKDNLGIKRSIGRHRLIAGAFICYDLREPKMVVNHINGIPGDDRISNLEWVTYSENIEHAIETGLLNIKVVPVIYRNRLTGEELRFPSIYECSLKTGLRYSFIHHRLKKPQLEYDDGIDLLIDDGRPWPLNRKKVEFRKFRSVCARNIVTGAITIFDNPRRAEEETGVKKRIISFHCDNELNLPINGFNFRYLKEDTQFPMHSEKSVRFFIDNPKQAIGNGYIFYKDGVEVEFHTSRLSAANAIGVGLSTFTRILSLGNPYKGIEIEVFKP